MTPINYVLKTKCRIIVCQITEEKNRVLVKLRCSKYGDFGDVEEMTQWLGPILGRYDTDLRPIVMDNPTSGQTLTVFGDENWSFGIIQPPRKKNG